jgi:hypothetical protein
VLNPSLRVVPGMANPAFRTRLHLTVNEHPIVLRNPYTSWFAKGALSKEEVARFTREFSVFSHQFIIAQLRKVIESPDMEAYHAGKEILLNELGVVFRPPGQPVLVEGTTPDVVSPTGTVDGATYRHAAAHFEWLVAFAKPLGLGFGDLGKRRHGSPTTVRFCDQVIELYGSSDPNVAAGASFAIEHWAAAGFWKELIQGLQRFKDQSGLPLNLGFWVFHDRLEQQHADHTSDELAELEATPGFDPEAFLKGARGLLEAVQGFWQGLADGRLGTDGKPLDPLAAQRPLVTVN